jgi:phage terminase large subunit-like protein
MPSRFDDAFIAEQKKKPIKYATLYQQQPQAQAGNIILRENLRVGLNTDIEPELQDYIVIVGDLTFGKSLNTEDKSCINIFGKRGRNINLLGELRGEWDIKGQLAALRAVHETYKGYNLQGIYIEEKANGRATIDLLKNKIDLLIPFNPNKFGFSADKRDRLNSVLYVLEELRYNIPDYTQYGFEWVIDYCNELCGFPRWACDDRVDCLSIGLKILEALPVLTTTEVNTLWLPQLPDKNSAVNIREMMGDANVLSSSNNLLRKIFY